MSPFPRRRRILVVDDDEMTLRLVTGLFEGAHSVVSTGNVTEALAHVETGRFDLVITDLEMPGLDGTDLIRGLASRSTNLPILVV